ncbi:hypothetical protein [Nonomuraea sp. B19D2]|uniref:2-amino-5-chloromuconate deaminase CnbZ n=1 Tax=Nonomuraea sp. B19D2 TaxID=3159561 RepID=UPI0032D9D55B
MSMLSKTPSGRGYSYLPAVAQYSAGVVADDGHELRRHVMSPGLPLADGFRAIEGLLAHRNLPGTALCALELRSPTAMTEDEFGDLNRTYRAELERLRILLDDANPVARTNVCPLDGTSAEPVIHAFTYARCATGPVPPTFVVAGSAEAPEGRDSYAGHAVASGDVSENGLAAKATWVLDEMERRLSALGQGWTACADVNVYTRFHGIGSLDGAVSRRCGQTTRTAWWQATPPVKGLEFEMDCRTVVPDEPSATLR